MRVGYYPHGYSVSRNLTSDSETGLGQWSVPQIVRALRDGQAPDRALNPFAMLWANFHNFTDDDTTAIATFLKMDRGRYTIPSRRSSPMVSWKPLR